MSAPDDPRAPASQDEFLARALASRELALQSGRYVPAAEVVASLEAQQVEANSKET